MADSASARHRAITERFQLFARRLASIPTKQPTNDVAGGAPPPPASPYRLPDEAGGQNRARSALRRLAHATGFKNVETPEIFAA
jgi:hypothetical protein